MTIVEFIEACVHEDYEHARLATESPWQVDPKRPNIILESLPIDSVGIVGERQYDLFTGQLSSRFGQSTHDTAHIVRWQPARVLAEVMAKRTIIADRFRHFETIDGEWGCCHDADAIRAGECPDYTPDVLDVDLTFRALARVYSDCPGFEPRWAEDL